MSRASRALPFALGVVAAAASCSTPRAVPRAAGAPATARVGRPRGVLGAAPCVDPDADARRRIEAKEASADLRQFPPARMTTPPDLDGDGQPDAVIAWGTDVPIHALVYVMRGTCGVFVGDVGSAPEPWPAAPRHHGLLDLHIIETAACEGEPCGCDEGKQLYHFDGTAYVLDAAASTTSRARACPDAGAGAP